MPEIRIGSNYGVGEFARDFAAPVAIGALNYAGQAGANRMNLQIAREQMAFQERMSGSAYQRAVEDMKLAGLNPMLAYSMGGASTPQGARAQMMNALGAAVSSAMQARRLSADLKLMHEQRVTQQKTQALLDAQKYKATQEGNTAMANYRLLSAHPAGQPTMPYALQQRIADMDYTKAMTYLTRLGYGAAGIQGSTAAGVLRLLFGGSGVVPGVVGAGATAVGAGLLGAGLRRGVSGAKRYLNRGSRRSKGSRGLKLRYGGSYNWPNRR